MRYPIVAILLLLSMSVCASQCYYEPTAPDQIATFEGANIQGPSTIAKCCSLKFSAESLICSVGSSKAIECRTFKTDQDPGFVSFCDNGDGGKSPFLAFLGAIADNVGKVSGTRIGASNAGGSTTVIAGFPSGYVLPEPKTWRLVISSDVASAAVFELNDGIETHRVDVVGGSPFTVNFKLGALKPGTTHEWKLWSADRKKLLASQSFEVIEDAELIKQLAQIKASAPSANAARIEASALLFADPDLRFDAQQTVLGGN